MPFFAVTAPHLTSEQHYELEESLMDIPSVDAFFNEEGALGTEVTSPAPALAEVVATIYGWASRHERGTSRVQVTCAGGKMRNLADHGPQELIAFLTTCSDDAAGLQGLTRRLADDGMHEGR